MGKNKGHTPIRTCIGCGKKTDKGELLRLTATNQGWVLRDVQGQGRGAYVCPKESCIKRAAETKRLSKAFRKRGPLHLLPSFSGADPDKPVES